MATDFSCLSTSTQGKKDFEEGWLRPRVLQAKAGECTVGLLGCADGLPRHLENNKAYGYTPKLSVIVDNDPKVIASYSSADTEGTHDN
jgi:hypothetical protein